MDKAATDWPAGACIRIPLVEGNLDLDLGDLDCIEVHYSSNRGELDVTLYLERDEAIVLSAALVQKAQEAKESG